MKIIIDTNVLFQYREFESFEIKTFLDVVSGIDAQFAMPKVIFDEFRAKCTRELKIAIQAAEKSLKEIGRYGQTIELPHNHIDEASLVEALAEHMMDKLRIRELIEYRDVYWNEIVRRSVYRIPPCSKKGEEIRDAIIWLMILDAAEQESDKRVVFITNDGGFFQGESLYQQLVDDCMERGVEVIAFKNISHFNQDHKDHVGFITPKWIEAKLPAESIVVLAQPQLDELFEDYLLQHLDATARLNQKVFPTGFFNILRHDLALQDYFLNRLSDGTVRIEAEYGGTFKVEAEVEYERFNRDGPFARPGTVSWKGVRGGTIFSADINAYIAVEISVIKEEVADVKIIDVG